MNSLTVRPASRVFCVSLLSYCTVAAADPAANPGNSSTLENVVITATRREESVDKVGSSITLLQAADVQALQKISVADVLTTTPGVTLSRNGGLGGTTTVRIRGAESDHTTVLIDGVKLNDPSAPGGGYNFANLLTSDDARIEILRGPQSTLWGSQAIGGVVNIVTPEPGGPFKSKLSTEYGTHNTSLTKAEAEAGNDVAALRVSAGYLTTDGISAFDENLGGREKDGYRNTGASVRGIVHITDNVTGELRATWLKGHNEFDGFPPPNFSFGDTREYGTDEELIGYGGLNIDSLGGRLHNRVAFGYTDTDRDNFDPALSVRKTFAATGRNKRWEYQGTFDFNERSYITVGLESERSELSSAAPNEFEPNPVPLARDVDLDSAYALLQLAPIDAVSVTLGTRYDDHETFGSNLSSVAAVAWDATASTIVRGSYGEGFKAPTLYQLFSEYGNTALNPESAHGWDAGVEQGLFDNTVVLSATYFSRDTANMIDFVSCAGDPSAICVARQPFGGYYDNVQKATSDGVELGARASIGRQVKVTANYTAMDVQNDVRGNANFHRQLPRRPREMLNADVTWNSTFGLSTTVAVQKSGRSFENAANTLVLDGYTVVDLRAAYDFSEALQLYGRIENLFDESYETVLRYGTLGRGAFAGFRLNF